MGKSIIPLRWNAFALSSLVVLGLSWSLAWAMMGETCGLERTGKHVSSYKSSRLPENPFDHGGNIRRTRALRHFSFTLNHHEEPICDVRWIGYKCNVALRVFFMEPPDDGKRRRPVADDVRCVTQRTCRPSHSNWFNLFRRNGPFLLFTRVIDGLSNIHYNVLEKQTLCLGKKRRICSIRTQI